MLKSRDLSLDYISSVRPKTYWIWQKLAASLSEYPTRTGSALGGFEQNGGFRADTIYAAHILPAAHPDSTDEVGNGIALCALHHRAFDRGLVTFDSGYRVHRRETMERRLAVAGLGGGLGDFQERLYRAIEVPSNLADQPKPIYIERVKAMRGWDL